MVKFLALQWGYNDFTKELKLSASVISLGLLCNDNEVIKELHRTANMISVQLHCNAFVFTMDVQRQYKQMSL